MSAEAAPRTARKRKNRWAAVALVAVAVLVAAVALSALLKPEAAPGDGMQTEIVSRQELVESASADGSMQLVEPINVYPAASGTVTHVYVKVGDLVRVGDRLFSIDGADLADQLAQATAQLRSAEQAQANAAQLLAQAELTSLQARQRLTGLESIPATTTAASEQLTVAREQVDVARKGVATAKAGVAASAASAASAQRAHDKAAAKAGALDVIAPADGTVISLGVDEGSSVSSASSGVSTSGSAAAASVASASSAGAAPVVIADTGNLKATIAVNEADLWTLAVGQSARLTFDAMPDIETTGTVSWIAPTGTSAQGVVTYAVDITLSARNDALHPEMTVNADITTATVADALVAPRATIKVDGSTNFVDVLAADGTTRRVLVTLGITTDTLAQILSGVDEGDIVVVGDAPEEGSDSILSPPPGMGGR